MNQRRLIKSVESAALLPSLALPVFSAASADGSGQAPVSRSGQGPEVAFRSELEPAQARCRRPSD